MPTLVHYDCTALVLNVSIIAIDIRHNCTIEFNIVLSSLSLFRQSCNVFQRSFLNSNREGLFYFFIILCVCRSNLNCNIGSTSSLCTI